MPAGTVVVRTEPVGNLTRPAVGVVEAERRSEGPARAELGPEPGDVLADGRIRGVAELLDREADHPTRRQLGDLGQSRADLEESPVVVEDRPRLLARGCVVA